MLLFFNDFKNCVIQPTNSTSVTYFVKIFTNVTKIYLKYLSQNHDSL